MAAVDSVEALRDRLGSVSRLTLVVDDAEAASEAAQGIEGVANPVVEDGAVVVPCTEPAVKLEVLDSVRDVTRVSDFTTEETSLDDVFAEVTHE